jgi:hypothetical protein
MNKKELLSFRTWMSPSLYASTAIILVSVFFWDGIDFLTPFLFPLLAAIIWLTFIGIFIGSIAKAFHVKEGGLFYRFRLVFLNIFAAIVAIYFPWGEWTITCNFNLNLPARMQVVELAKENKLKHYDYNKDMCALPSHLKYLSKGGGDVIVTDKNKSSDKIDPATLHVFFFTFRGILDSYSGFEYSADDKPPSDAMDAREISHLQKNWYWVAY